MEKASVSTAADIRLDEGVVRAYREKGAACLRGLIEPQWLALLAKGIERNLGTPGRNARHYNKGKGTGFFFADAAMWQSVPEYREFLFHSPAAAIAGRLMGAREVHIFFDNIMIKDAGTTAPTPWHHDLPYVPMAGGPMCNLWLALDSVPRENSPEYVAGSHRWGQSFRPRSFFEPEKDYDAGEFTSSALHPIPDVDARRNEFEIMSWAMEPGDIQAFDGMVVHGAPGNTTGHRRRAFVSRWAGNGAVFADRGPETYPVFPECGLKAGEALGGPDFPVVWRE
jgi:ectoine hydroxylase-related dioxygenase (phytanoyl-CoA dioxygenase family)